MVLEGRRSIAIFGLRGASRSLTEREELLVAVQVHSDSRISCHESQRHMLAMPNVGGELTAQARRLGREAENTQSRRTAKVPCRSGSARLTG